MTQGTRTGTATRRWFRNRAVWAHIGLLAGGCGKPPCEETLTCPPPRASAGHAGTGGATAGKTGLEPQNGGSGSPPATSGGAAGDSDKEDANRAGETATPTHSGAGEGGSEPNENPSTSGEGGGAPGGAGAGNDGPEPRCKITKPFDPPAYVASLSSDSYSDASLTADGLTMIVWRGDDLASSARATLDDPFGSPVSDPLMAVAAARFALSQDQELPKISPDRLTLYSEYGGQNLRTIYAAKRTSPLDAFSDAQEVPELGRVNRGAPFPAFDDQALYFRQDRHLYLSSRRADGRFDTPTALTSLNSPEGEDHPIPRHDELTIYFSTSRSDGKAKGEDDIWVARRQSTSDDFDPPQAVEELNTSSSEFPAWVSADECELFFIRYVYVSATASWSPRVMSARRPK